jgi:anthranilate synthase component 1
MALRNVYRKTCLLESNDYHSRQNSKSYIGLEPIVEVQRNNTTLSIQELGHTREIELASNKSHSSQVQEVLNSYNFDSSTKEVESSFNGFFGRLGFEFTQQDETHLESPKTKDELPLLHLFIFRYVIVIDHFTSEGFILENSTDKTFFIRGIQDLIQTENALNLPFELFGNERALFSDETFRKKVTQGIEHCRQGNVFQLVLSNAFEQSFFGDDFQVYRHLRQLNPSPYLFYFDFENYRVFGSSPEAQLVIKNGRAEIHPIAGTVPKTGIKETDDQQLEFLLKDEKENAEHTMLVDLARNDLSRNCTEIQLESYKEVQSFSHVTHLVSKVVGNLKEQNNFEALCNSFPAGTLSGTPKPRALELIDQLEDAPRSFYGGAIGQLTAKSNLNMAIVIRSILSQNNTLHYRAGAGIVIDSEPDREVQEVHHKLRAIRKAIQATSLQFQPSKKQHLS